MSYFADSSALVKLYADEEQCETIRAIESLVVAEIARVEVPAALWRKSRMGNLSGEDAALLVADFEADWFGDRTLPPRFAVISTAPVVETAARLAATRSLRAYDAVQLAAALAAAAADPDLQGLAAFDQALRSAAAAEGVHPYPRQMGSD